jgi:hypothetical protein
MMKVSAITMVPPITAPPPDAKIGVRAVQHAHDRDEDVEPVGLLRHAGLRMITPTPTAR